MWNIHLFLSFPFLFLFLSCMLESKVVLITLPYLTLLLLPYLTLPYLTLLLST